MDVQFLNLSNGVKTVLTDLHIYISPLLILKVKVKVMHILTVNVLQMVTDRTNIIIGNK